MLSRLTLHNWAISIFSMALEHLIQKHFFPTTISNMQHDAWWTGHNSKLSSLRWQSVNVIINTLSKRLSGKQRGCFLLPGGVFHRKAETRPGKVQRLRMWTQSLCLANKAFEAGVHTALICYMYSISNNIAKKKGHVVCIMHSKVQPSHRTCK